MYKGFNVKTDECYRTEAQYGTNSEHNHLKLNYSVVRWKKAGVY